jgi:2-polyprenyl-3-methyl-5-hydroxy-6-metoxy-1,4-benzoquinol methylase
MMLNKIWDKIWSNDSYSMPEVRIEKAVEKINIMNKVIRIDRNTTIIDLGCGGGYISKYIYDNNQCNIVGVDFSSEAIEVAKKNCAGLPISFFCSSADKTELLDNIADVVVCFGVLEHIEDINSTINEILRILKNNGLLFITSSNKKSFMYYHRKIKEILKVWKYGYQKNWHPLELKKYMEKHGFVTEYFDSCLGIGDFKYITIFDTLLRLFDKQWGRYIIYAGRKL